MFYENEIIMSRSIPGVRVPKELFRCIQNSYCNQNIYNQSINICVLLHIQKKSLPPGGLPCWGNSIGAAILHGPAENVFPHKSGYTR